MVVPGFKNQHGTVFSAQIQPCTDSKLTNPFMEQKAISIYPNPAKNQATVELNLDAAGTVNLNLTDMTGKKIQVILNNDTKVAGLHQIQVDTSKLLPGIYYCTLYNDDLISTQKLIVFN